MEKDFNISSSIKEKVRSLTSGNSESTKLAMSYLKETDLENKKPEEYLIDSESIKKIYLLVKDKKKSRNTIKKEIKKYLKDPNDLNLFLKSILNSRVKKEENKEAMSTGGAVGAFEPKLSLSKKTETKEATSSSSVGVYDAPGFEDVKMKGNHKRGGGRSFKKTQIPGGKFVEVKKKCKRFPYCNQGDIKALRIFENEMLNNKINIISEKYGLHKDFIIEIIYNEMLKTKK